MTKAEILNKITENKMIKAEILDSVKKEAREITNVEQLKCDTATDEIRNLEKQITFEIQKPEIKVGEDRKIKQFSLIRSINDYVEGRQASESMLEQNEIGKKVFSGSGVDYKGQILLRMEDMFAEKRAEIVAGTLNAGQEVISEDKLGLILGLRAQSILFKAGAQLLSGLKGDVSIPTYTNSTVNWKGETTIATDGAGSFDEITLSPKRLAGFIDVSKQFLNQDSISANQLLMDDLKNAVIAKLESTIFGAASGNTTQPAGLFYGASYTSTGTTTFAKVVALESAVNTANALMGNIAYVTTPALKGIMKTTAKANNAAIFVQEAETVNGYPVYTSSAVASGKMALANWADYIVGNWGGIDLLIDPYSQAIYGKVRIVINAYFDAKLRRAASFAYANLS